MNQGKPTFNSNELSRKQRSIEKQRQNLVQDLIKDKVTFDRGGNNDTISFDSMGEGLKDHPADFFSEEQKLMPLSVTNTDLFTTDANRSQID